MDPNTGSLQDPGSGYGGIVSLVELEALTFVLEDLDGPTLMDSFDFFLLDFLGMSGGFLDGD